MIDDQSKILIAQTLDYSNQLRDQQEALACWIGSVAVVYAATCIGADVSQAVYIWPKIFGFWSIDLVGFLLVLNDVISCVGATLLLYAGLMTLGRKSGGRPILAWSCAVIVVSKVIKELMAASIFIMKQDLYRLGADSSMYATTPWSLSSMLFSIMQTAFVPILLILISRKWKGIWRIDAPAEQMQRRI